MPKSKRPPSYRHHKARNCGVVTIGGVPHYLGPYGSTESFRRYGALLAEKFGEDTPTTVPVSPPSSVLSISQLMLRYWTEYADRRYRKNGKPTDRWYHYRIALRLLRKLFGNTAATEFGPRKLKVVREAMIVEGLKRKPNGLNRNYVNDHVDIVRRMFRWGAEEELLPAAVVDALNQLTRIGKDHDSRLAERRKVQPVPAEHVRKTLPFLSPQLAAMVQLQELAGMRPDEVTIMRPCDIERRGQEWIYRPESHKLEVHEIERCVALGPQARALLIPWLTRAPTAYLFNPREVIVAQRAALRRSGEPVSEVFRTTVREHYDDESYCQAVERACKRAGVPKWTPNQLRHNAATNIESQFDEDAARVVLGHRSVSTTKGYVKRDLKKAIKITEQMG